jgi:outer membrane protein OmpA-like peptidoglycan-associated protein/opacity protein-like surface antigen
MRLAVRFMGAVAVAFVMVSALYADGTARPADIPKKGESLNSTAVPGTSAKPKPTGKALVLLPALSLWQTPTDGGTGKHSKKHGPRSREQGNTTPKVELFMGYSFWRAVPDSTSNRIDAMHGGTTSAAFNLNNRLALVFDFGGFNVDSLELSSLGGRFSPSRVVDVEGNVFTFLFGPRVSFRNRGRLTPFLQVLAGVAHADDVTLTGCPAPILACRPLPEETAFAVTAGGGLDFRVNHRIALRLLQAEYLPTRFRDPTSLTGDRGWQNNVRLSAGVVFGFGGNAPVPQPPNRPPVASCSVDKTIIYAGSGDIAEVHAVASDPDNDPLTYSWTTNAGTVEGTGPEARWNSSGATPGIYVVKVRVEDGHGGGADCSADIRVEPRPNRPPTMSCSTNRNSLLIGEPVQINAAASDPDGDPLTYSWNSSGGRVRGTEASAKFDTSGLKAGHYFVTGHVDDSHGGTSDCQLTIEVQEPPPPPEMVELETRLALHSIYFQTARPSSANPTGGLVGSQEKILTTLAEDFKRYLTFRPEAHLILGGHADQRGSRDYNKGLTERRVERAKNFLVGHGVSATAIETRSFGDEDNLNAAQVKEQIAQNPDLTPDDRRQMLNNLQVMVLANNRRVDVSLSTTGQQSTHRYPFNAKDFLALINIKGGEAKPSARSAPKKKATQ